MKQNPTQKNVEGIVASNRRNYRAPELIAFGSLRHFTQAGSGALSEIAMMGLMRMVVSDMRLKQNIVRIGQHPLGIGLYLFDYKPECRDVFGQGRQFGVMAQEVETIMPEAVSIRADGYKMVNYAMLGISRAVH